MNSEQEELKQIVEKAIKVFNAKEKYLLENDLSERCVCSRFALYLQKIISRIGLYKEYIVDVEYNRGADGKDYAPKRLGHDSSPITVDIIVHKRGHKDQVRKHGRREIIGYCNLICIEMKKDGDVRGEESVESDRERLYTMTRMIRDIGDGNIFGYSIGFLISASNEKLSISETFADEYCCIDEQF